MVLRTTNLVISNDIDKDNWRCRYKTVKLNRSWRWWIDFLEISDKDKNLWSTWNIRIMLEWELWFTELEVPELISEKLWEYIRDRWYMHYQSRGNFDCFDFAHLLNWVSYEEKWFEYDKWTISDNTSWIQPWDTILLCNVLSWEEKSTFQIWPERYIADRLFHFAVYIWNGLYISKLWKWEVYVTTLDEMRKLYDYKNVLKLTSKNIEDIRKEFSERALKEVA